MLVEDDLVVAEAIRRSMQKANMLNRLVVATDGVEALEILRGQHGSSKIAQSFLIVLDLNLPKMNGIEFLDELRRDEDLAQSVVFVLTTSNDDFDVMDSYRENVAGYLVKSKAGPDYIKLINLLKHFVDIVEFPRKPFMGTVSDGSSRGDFNSIDPNQF